MAWQGFVCSLEEDAAAVRLFAGADLELLVAQSFSKSMGLYGERVGALHLVAASAGVARGAEAALQEVGRRGQGADHGMRMLAGARSCEECSWPDLASGMSFVWPDHTPGGVPAPSCWPARTPPRSAHQPHRFACCLQLIVPMYATPPKYGAAIATAILADPQLRQQWKVRLLPCLPACVASSAAL